MQQHSWPPHGLGRQNDVVGDEGKESGKTGAAYYIGDGWRNIDYDAREGRRLPLIGDTLPAAAHDGAVSLPADDTIPRSQNIRVREVHRPVVDRLNALLSVAIERPTNSHQAVADKVPAMLSIMFDVMTDANLDSQQRVVEMLKESKVSCHIHPLRAV